MKSLSICDYTIRGIMCIACMLYFLCLYAILVTVVLYEITVLTVHEKLYNLFVHKRYFVCPYAITRLATKLDGRNYTCTNYTEYMMFICDIWFVHMR